MDAYAEAIERFRVLFEKAKQLDMPEPSAMTLATADEDGRPSVRTVLLKAFDERGFVFYTNKLSRKGRQLATNPQAALCFLWQPLMEQVLVEGVIQEVTAQEADAYWSSRARISQIGGWASRQSEELSDRAELERRFAEYEKKYHGGSIPRPPHWSGYRVVPDRIEFWHSRPGRLHVRELYAKTDGRWGHRLLFP